MKGVVKGIFSVSVTFQSRGMDRNRNGMDEALYPKPNPENLFTVFSKMK